MIHQPNLKINKSVVSLRKENINFESWWLITSVRLGFMLVANVCQLFCQRLRKVLKMYKDFLHVPAKEDAFDRIPPQIRTPPLGVSALC